MKLSLKWLNKFLSLDGVQAEEVASKLTMSAFEVESISQTGSKLTGPITVGEILAIEKHPKADRLFLATVTTNKTNKLQIVCGAANIKIRQKVPVALPGAVVRNRKDGSELLIKPSKIRDVESQGMLCSPGELGLETTEADGILILPEDSKTGESVIDYLCLEQDTILEIAARSNRGDAQSVWGIGKEIAALLNKKFLELATKTFKFDNSVQNLKSKIESFEDTCLFYTVSVENIKVQESPPWLKKLLESVGIRSINNIVDITNYINISFGQPMHAYDKEKLYGEYLTARDAKNGEEILTLDEKRRILPEDVLVIADGKGPVAIAGIMGGKESEVTESTRAITLEAAVFNPVKVRKGSRKIGLTSEASKRFERGVDSNFTYSVLLKALELIEDIAKPNDRNLRISTVHKEGNPVNQEVKIKLNLTEIKRVLDITISVQEASRILKLLGFSVKQFENDNLEVLVPAHRKNDILRSIDLIEEIARIYGYNLIFPVPPKSTIAAHKSNRTVKSIKNFFLAAGFSECYLSSLIGENTPDIQSFNFNDNSAVKMVNPISREHSLLRQSLAPGLLESLRLNQSHQICPVRLFESGKIYLKQGKTSEKSTGVSEKLNLCCMVSGFPENWFTNKLNYNQTIEDFLFFSIKGILESFLKKFVPEYKLTKSQESFLHPNFSLLLTLNNNNIGWYGLLHPKNEKIFGIKGPVALCEINIDTILSNISKDSCYTKISSQPVVFRDITVDLVKKFDSESVLREINLTKSNFIQDINILNTYNLDQDNRSLTFRLKMQDFEQTLSSVQIEEEVTKIKNHLTSCFQAKFRV